MDTLPATDSLRERPGAEQGAGDGFVTATSHSLNPMIDKFVSSRDIIEKN